MASDQSITSRHDHSVTDRTPVHIGLPFAPRAPLRAALAELIFRAGFRNLPVRVILPDGQRWGGGGADTPVMYLARPAEFFRRIGTDANIGLGEAYQAGDWRSPDLVDLLTVLADRLATAIPPWAQTLRLQLQRRRRHPHANTIAVARRNAAAHYDLFNETLIRVRRSVGSGLGACVPRIISLTRRYAGRPLYEGNHGHLCSHDAQPSPDSQRGGRCAAPSELLATAHARSAPLPGTTKISAR